MARRKIQQTCFQASAISEMKFPPRCRSPGNFREQIETTADASGLFLAKFSREIKIIPSVAGAPFMSRIYFCSATILGKKYFTHVLVPLTL